MSTFTIDTSTSRATPSPVPGKRMTVPSIRARKQDGRTERPVVMLTAYTMRMAQLLDPHVDLLMVTGVDASEYLSALDTRLAST